MVLLPLAYYEASILTEKVTSPTHIDSDNQYSLHFGYPNIFEFNVIYGSAGYLDLNGTRSRSVQLYEDYRVNHFLLQ